MLLPTRHSDLLEQSDTAEDGDMDDMEWDVAWSWVAPMPLSGGQRKYKQTLQLHKYWRNAGRCLYAEGQASMFFLLLPCAFRLIVLGGLASG